MPFQNRIEIMAPAGSFESLAAALQGGADSVYFGVGKLNMRSRATVNFSEKDLPEIVERCHEAGAKAYLTLNIIVYDEELEACMPCATPPGKPVWMPSSLPTWR